MNIFLWEKQFFKFIHLWCKELFNLFNYYGNYVILVFSFLVLKLKCYPLTRIFMVSGYLIVSFYIVEFLVLDKKESLLIIVLLLKENHIIHIVSFNLSFFKYK